MDLGKVNARKTLTETAPFYGIRVSTNDGGSSSTELYTISRCALWIETDGTIGRREPPTQLVRLHRSSSCVRWASGRLRLINEIGRRT